MDTPTTFKELVAEFLNIINILVPAILGIAFVFLVWKIIDTWVVGAGDEKKREEGKRMVMVSILVMVLVIVVWGVVALLRSSLLGY